MDRWDGGWGWISRGMNGWMNSGKVEGARKGLSCAINLRKY